MNQVDIDMFAGFWRRVGAHILDVIILMVVGFIVGIVISLIMPFPAPDAATMERLKSGDTAAIMDLYASMLPNFAIRLVVGGITGWLYFACFESSALQGTPGKMALGIKVTDMDGSPISFLRATGRYFSKIVSGIILYIGYAMAGFTEKRQCLHDMMTGCLVVKK